MDQCYASYRVDVQSCPCIESENLSTTSYTTSSSATTSSTWSPMSTTTTLTTTAITSTTITTATTFYNRNPCYEHVCENGKTCFEIDDQATCVTGTIGFLTHDKLMTINCGKDSKMWMKTKQQCIGQEPGTRCDDHLERVIIHQIDFAPTPRRNEYYIPTHPMSNTTMAMYHKKSHNNYNKVVHVKTSEFDSSKYGKTWYMDKIDCEEDECPYFIRAAEDRTRAWKRTYENGEGQLADLGLGLIDEKNTDFMFYIQVQT